MAACTDDSCTVQYLARDGKRRAFKHEHANATAQDIWQRLRDDLIRIGHLYFDFTLDMVRIEEYLHDTWDELIHAGTILPPCSPEQDRLVTLVLEMRELGTFAHRTDRDSEVLRELAVMPNGQRVWSELPYLAEDFQTFWIAESVNLYGKERESLAALTAKLCATGVCPGNMASCALWLFKEVLEAEGAPMSGDDISKKAQLSIAELLPACHEWLKYGNHQLAKRCAENYQPTYINSSFSNIVSTSPGILATNANVEGEGFSMLRWLFWRQRFAELMLSEVEQVVKPARSCFELMIGTGRGIGISIPGEKIYLERLFEALDKELVARNMRGCVGPEDIEIDPAWANEE